VSSCRTVRLGSRKWLICGFPQDIGIGTEHSYFFYFVCFLCGIACGASTQESLRHHAGTPHTSWTAAALVGYRRSGEHRENWALRFELWSRLIAVCMYVYSTALATMALRYVNISPTWSILSWNNVETRAAVKDRAKHPYFGSLGRVHVVVHIFWLSLLFHMRVTWASAECNKLSDIV
jgi:hypothetical protein